jgi:hypothetical protein
MEMMVIVLKTIFFASVASVGIYLIIALCKEVKIACKDREWLLCLCWSFMLIFVNLFTLGVILTYFSVII